MTAPKISGGKPRQLFFKIPPGTKASKCNGKERGGTCEAACYWIRTKNGKPLLVDCNVEGGKTPSESADASQLSLLGATEVHEGWGVAHFATCPDARRFRNER